MSDATTVKLIQFTAGDQPFCMRADSVVRIQRQATLTLNAGGAPYGWILEKGKRIPAYHCAQSLRIHTRFPGRRSQILILEQKEKVFAILVDRVDRVLDLPRTEIRPLPMALANCLDDFFEGLVHQERGFALVLAPEKLISRTSRRKILLPPKPETPGSGVWRGAKVGSWRPTLLLFSLTTQNIAGKRMVFGLSISQIGEIMKPLPLHAMPGAHPSLMGLLEWRDQPVPLIDLNHRIRDEPTPVSSRKRFLIARTRAQGEFLGFPVHTELRFMRPTEEFKPSEKRIPLAAPLVRGIFENEKEVLIIPFLEGIVSSG